MKALISNAAARIIALAAALLIPMLMTGAEAKQVEGSVGRTQESPRVAYFQQGNCPFNTANEAGLEFRCGWVALPEDRAAPGSRTIRIAVAVASRRGFSDGAPTVVVEGGPGQPAIAFWSEHLKARSDHPLLAAGDVVLIDQRGTGFSQGGFCRELQVDANMGLARPRLDAAVTKLRSCIEDARRSGVAVEAYSTWHNAADFRDLRQALRYPQWNLYALSYGTSLAQAIMRRDPNGVRAAVLDSVLPAQPRHWDLYSRGMRAALNRLQAACAADPQCRERFPNLPTRAEAVVRGYADGPLDLAGLDPRAFANGRYRFDGNSAAEAIYTALHARPLFSTLPVMIEALEGRDPETAGAYAEQLFQLPADGYGYGMAVAASCRDGGTANRDETARQRRSEPIFGPALRDGVWGRLCAALALNRPDEAAQPLSSNVPVLVFAGEWDPITPVEFARQIMPGLSRGTLVEVPHTGHLASFSPCAGTIYAAFLRQPERAVDTSCLARIPPPAFVTRWYGTHGGYRLARDAVSGKWFPAIAGLVLAGATCLVAFILLPIAGLLARRRRRVEDGTGSRGLLLAWLGVTVSLVGLGAVVFAISTAAFDAPLLLPVGLPSWSAAGAWGIVLGAILTLAAVVSRRSGGGKARGGRVVVPLTFAAALSLALIIAWNGLLGL